MVSTSQSGCVCVCVLPASVGAMCQNVEDGCVTEMK